MTHVDSGWECCVGGLAHQPPCIKCANCGEYIRPERINDECPAKPIKGITTKTGFNFYDQR